MNGCSEKVSMIAYHDSGLIRLVTSFVEESAKAFGLGIAETLKLTLACEEIFLYLCQIGRRGEEIKIEVGNGGYYTQVKFLFKVRDFNLRSFNLTANVSLEDKAGLEQMGLLIASRSVERFYIIDDPSHGFGLVLIKEKSYPELTEIKLPEIKPIKRFTIKIPDADDLKFFSRLVVINYPTHLYLPALSFPGKMVDMVRSNEYNAVMAIGDGGQVVGGILWHRVGMKLIEFFGPYIFNQPSHFEIAEGLIDTCIAQIAKMDVISLISRYSTPELPKGYFDSLGSVNLIQSDGLIKPFPIYYRQLHEDPGCQVWAHPDLEEFLRTEYSRLFFAREIRSTKHEGEQRSPYSVFTVQFDRAHGQVTIHPIWEGTDSFENIAQHIKILRAENLPNIFFEIDLGQSWQANLTPSLLGNGFRPRLILPYGGEADVVIFQYQEGK